ncbi:MAG: S49 family peptidase [Planctomycetota bacterium]
MTTTFQRAVARLSGVALAAVMMAACVAWPATAQDTAVAESEAVEVGWDSTVGWLKLGDALREGPAPFAWISEDDAGPSLRGVLNKLDVVANQDHYMGLVIALDRPMLTLTQVSAIGERIGAIRASGKTVVVFSEEYDTLTYLLASYCDMVVLQRGGSMGLRGLGMEEMYMAGLLEKIGAEADLLQIGKYKGADEQLTRTGPSEAWSENMDALLDDLYASIVDVIAANRGMDRATLETQMADSWVMGDAEYLRSGLVDRVSSRDLIEVTEVEFGDQFVWDDAMGESMSAMRVTSPMALFGMLFEETDMRPTQPTIAVIHAAGPITSGESTIDGGPFSSESIGSKTMLEALGLARDEQEIKAVVIRLDSPGGSAIASEVIWQAVRELADSKPVFVSIGGMAASGGYYIACAADEVYVMPQSIVGSIGVVSGKIVLGGTYEKLGIGVTRRERGPRSGMFNSVDAFTDEQRAVVRTSMQRIYDQFRDRVVTGRGNRLPDVGAIDAGRLFTGRQAIENGMADEIGGLSAAIAAAAERAGLGPDAYAVIDLPQPMSFQEYLSELLGDTVRSPSVGAPAEGLAAVALARGVMGDEAWTQVSRTLDGLLMLREESVLTLMPTALILD